jgi:DNA-binding LytR/AlgR family response regulator
MTNPITILVVEDEMIIAAKISLKLTNLGYEVTGIIPRGEEALVHVAQNAPDIVLLDINLKGELDGIETATQILKNGNNCVIIYLTANNDEETFNRAKITRPFAFLSKPINPIDLKRTLELTVERILKQREIEGLEGNEKPENHKDEEFLSDRIFVKVKEKMVKIFVADILYVSAERSYSEIFTLTDKYLLSIPLKSVEDKLPEAQFMRVHRSYLVNITQIDELAESHVFFGKKAIPISSSAKEALLKRLNRI